MIEALVSSWMEVYSGIMAQHRDQSTCADAVRTHDRERWLTASLAPNGVWFAVGCADGAVRLVTVRSGAVLTLTQG